MTTLESSCAREANKDNSHIWTNKVVSTSSHRRRIEQSRTPRTLQRIERGAGRGRGLDLKPDVIVDDDVETITPEDIKIQDETQVDTKVAAKTDKEVAAQADTEVTMMTQADMKLFVHTNEGFYRGVNDLTFLTVYVDHMSFRLWK